MMYWGQRLQDSVVVSCRLRETDGKMEVLCLRVLKPTVQCFTMGAVAGSTLYLTTFREPLYGALLGVDLTRDVDEEVRHAFCQCINDRKP